jgi:fumarylpyruvate hydrolase
VHHELELVVALSKGGSAVPSARARGLVGAVTLGLDLTLRDVQAELKQRRRPWELSKAFDRSAPVGDWVDATGVDLGAVEMCCRVNGEVRQRGSTTQMLFSVPRLIEILSSAWELLPGDVLFTGTPSGVGPVFSGDEVVVESPQLGSWKWR